MKKIIHVISTLVIAFALILNVKAWSIATFDAAGRVHTMEGNLTDSFTQYMQGLNKYSDGTTTIEMTSQKHGILGWSNIDNKSKLCNYSGKGTIPEGRCTLNLSVNGTVNIRSKWKQNNQGNMTADLGRDD